MPIKIAWDDDQQLTIIAEFMDEWTWAQYDAAIAEVYRMLNNAQHEIDIIVDTRRGNPNRETEAPLGHFKRALKTMPHNVGTMIVIRSGKNTFEENLFAAILQVYRKVDAKTLYADSVQEARAMLVRGRAMT